MQNQYLSKLRNGEILHTSDQIKMIFLLAIPAILSHDFQYGHAVYRCQYGRKLRCECFRKHWFGIQHHMDVWRHMFCQHYRI